MGASTGFRFFGEQPHITVISIACRARASGDLDKDVLIDKPPYKVATAGGAGTRAVAHIRGALAIRNAELGVSAKLAEASRPIARRAAQAIAGAGLDQPLEAHDIDCALADMLGAVGHFAARMRGADTAIGFADVAKSSPGGARAENASSMIS